MQATGSVTTFLPYLLVLQESLTCRTSSLQHCTAPHVELKGTIVHSIFCPLRQVMNVLGRLA